MKKKIIFPILFIVLAIVTILILLEVKAQNDQLVGDDVLDIESKVLNETRTLLVHLPKDYNTNLNKSYPILLALDGTSHDQDILNNDSKIPDEIIIIGIPNTSRNRDLTPEYLNQDVNSEKLGEGDKFLSFIEKELIPLIEKKYRTNNYKMISGHSRAGMFNLYALLEKPDLFDAYFCYSPALWKNDNLIIAKLEDYINQKGTINSFVYMSLGTEENTKMKYGFDAAIKLLGNLNNVNLRFHYNYTEGAKHGTNAYYSIPLALKTWHKEYLLKQL